MACSSKFSEKFLSLFDPDPDIAEARVEDLRKRLEHFLEWRNYRWPEDGAQEAIKRGLARLSEEEDLKVSNPSAWFFGIASKIAREGWRPRREQPLEEWEDFRAPFSWDAVDAKILLDQLLSGLEPDARELFLRYHREDLDRLSEELNLPKPALSLKVHRIKRDLEDLAAGLSRPSRKK